MVELRIAEQPAQPAATRLWTLLELERFVRSHVAVDPVAAEELRYYLLYLRHHAGANGVLPAPFAPLVESVFGPLLAAAEQQGRQAA